MSPRLQHLETTATDTRFLYETEDGGAPWYWKDNLVYSDFCQDTGLGARNYILNFRALCQYSLICSTIYILQKSYFSFLQQRADVGILPGNSQLNSQQHPLATWQWHWCSVIPAQHSFGHKGHSRGNQKANRADQYPKMTTKGALKVRMWGKVSTLWWPLKRLLYLALAVYYWPLTEQNNHNLISESY